MLEPIRYFLTHPFGITVVASSVLVAGFLAAEMGRRRTDWSTKRLILASALPLPFLCAIATTALFLISPWDDPLLEAVLLTVGFVGTLSTIIAGSLTAWLVAVAVRR